MATCAVCGYEAAGFFRFCPECGARADRRARGQRKVVTVLFCDIAGSTALGESRDAETFRALLARYFDRMKVIVERHGGLVEKFIGDAVMAVFGLPIVHEDDAVRALRAAAEMQLALPDLGIECAVARGRQVRRPLSHPAEEQHRRASHPGSAHCAGARSDRLTLRASACYALRDR